VDRLLDLELERRLERERECLLDLEYLLDLERDLDLDLQIKSIYIRIIIQIYVNCLCLKCFLIKKKENFIKIILQS